MFSPRTVFIALLLSLATAVPVPADTTNKNSAVCLELVETYCDGNASGDIMSTCVESGILTCARPSFCAEAAMVGMCRAAFPKFYFNFETGACESFIYGGCGGNLNNFDTLNECEEACRGVRYCEGSSGVACPSNMKCANEICVPETKK